MTQHREEREDLKLELERLVTRMEEKGAQITKLRKHWKMVCHDKSTLKHNFEVILLHKSNFLKRLALHLLIVLQMTFTGYEYIYRLTLWCDT